MQMDPGTARLANRALNSKAMRTVARGAGRAAETGLEGAVLSILNEQDPFEVAGYAAGGQMLGSAGLAGTKGLLRGGPLKAGAKIGMAAVATGSLVQLAKSATPGGRNFILESLETGFDKVKWGLAVGALGGMAGGGRLRGQRWAEDLPRLTDAMATLPRGAMISAIRQWRDADERGEGEAIERTLERLGADEFFGEETTRQLRRAFEQERLGEEVNRLLDTDENFRAALEAPVRQPQQQLREDVRADNRGAPVVSSAAVARSVAQRTGGTVEESPRAFLRGILSDEDRAGRVLPRLSDGLRADLLEVGLSDIIDASTKRSGDRRVIDPERLATAWTSLPEATRGAYTERQQRAVEAFIDEARAVPDGLAVLPPFAAHALLIDGELTSRLIGVQDDG